MGDDTPSDSGPIAGRYTLDRIIGSGAAAVVYAGRDLAADRAVAVKVYRPGGSLQPRLQQNREIAALARLRHDGLVTLYDGGIETDPDGRTYLVTDLVDGPTLAERLRNGPLDARMVRDLAAELASALAHVHSRGFIHRDIKPANILLDGGHRPRLADFGIAKALDGTVATATGAVAGTAAYLAPEQVRGGAVEAAADVYALGLVLLEALTGRREYPGTVVESATARLYRRPVVPTGLPWNLTALLESMTDPDPAERPTAEAVAAATAAPPVSHTAQAAAPSHPERFRRRGQMPALVAAALLLICLIGGAALLVGSAGSTGPPPPASNDATEAAAPLSPAGARVMPISPAAAAPAAPTPALAVEKAASLAVYANPVPGTRDRTARQAPAPDDHTATAQAAGEGKDKGKGNAKGKGNGSANGNGNGNRGHGNGGGG